LGPVDFDAGMLDRGRGEVDVMADQGVSPDKAPA
jgi:hypothetical protein